MILSGTNHVFAKKNAVLTTYVSYCPREKLLGHFELAAPGILLKTNTFSYLSKEVLQSGAAEAVVLVQRKLAMEMARSGGGKEGECQDPNCKNPNCPSKKGGNQSVCTDPNCKNPSCPSKNGSTKGGGTTANVNTLGLAKSEWDRKMANSNNSKKKKTKPVKEISLTPSVVSLRNGGVSSFSTYQQDSGIQTYWEHRYPPQSKSDDNLNVGVLNLVKIMRDSFGVPWKTIPDPTLGTIVRIH